MEGRSVLDALVRSATVELFQGQGIFVAPIDRPPAIPSRLGQHLGGYVSFVGRGFTGNLTLLLPEAVFGLAKQDGAAPYNPLDWIRELTNQLLGRIKNRLAHFQLTLNSGLPTALTGTYLERTGIRGQTLALYAFRTLRGEVFVILRGTVDFSKLVYSGSVGAANEGDIILF